MVEIEICVLASGSGGNSIYVSSGDTAVLVDCGVSCREVTRRLACAGAGVETLSAILVTHGHSDHVRGVGVTARRLGIPVMANQHTARRVSAGDGTPPVVIFETGGTFDIGELRVAPFAVPHDAPDPVGFTISDGRVKAGIATDLGSVTLEVLSGLEGCDAVILESNHDRDMLLNGPYPWHLKRRVDGPSGHLSNDDAATVIESVRHRGLRHLVLAHLSRTNNDPELTVSSATRALGRSGSRVEVTVGLHDSPCGMIIL